MFRPSLPAAAALVGHVVTVTFSYKTRVLFIYQNFQEERTRREDDAPRCVREQPRRGRAPANLSGRVARPDSLVGLHPTDPYHNMADLVTAIAIGYDIAHFAVFVGSLRAHYSGDVTLFGSANTSSRIVSFCARQRVELRTDSVRLGLNTSSKMRLMHSRFLLYAQACTRPKYGLCLASDFRDIFFQAHPFASLRRRFGGAASLPDLLAPMETDSLPAPEDGADGKATPGTIAASPINRNWLRTCYGDGAASLIGNRSILNVRSARGPRGARLRP